METYADTDQVRFEYEHFAFIGQESVRAAEAAECANEQDQFWQYHDTLFLNQHGENLGTFDDPALKNFSNAIGLDEEAFNECLDSGRYSSQIGADQRTGGALGVTSTPTLIINGQLLEGVPPFETLQEIIEDELSN